MDRVKMREREEKRGIDREEEEKEIKERRKNYGPSHTCTPILEYVGFSLGE
jgi:hypothetical protein